LLAAALQTRDLRDAYEFLGGLHDRQKSQARKQDDEDKRKNV
jgi:hypothetical protein